MNKYEYTRNNEHFYHKGTMSIERKRERERETEKKSITDSMRSMENKMAITIAFSAIE